MASKITLVIIFILLSAIVLLRSYYDPGCFLSPDSIDYLRFSQSILAGNGMYVPDLTEPGGNKYFAVWPAGYPAFIAALTFITSIEPVWASKVLNCLFTGFTLLLLWRLFRYFAPVVALVLFGFTYIFIYTHTWSEAAFLQVILLFVYSLYMFYTAAANKIWEWAAIVLLTSISLFLLRYIGAISIICMGIVCVLLFLKRANKRAIVMAGGCIINGVVIFLYLLKNKVETGYTTGIKRIEPPENTLELLDQLKRTLKGELVPIRFENVSGDIIFFTLCAVLVGVILWRFYKVKKAQPVANRMTGFWIFCLATAIIYLVTLFILRASSHFDALDYRLVAPFSFLATISLFSVIYFNTDLRVKKYFTIPIVLLISLYLTAYWLPFTYFRSFADAKWIPPKEFHTCENTLNRIRHNYAFLPENSILIFGENIVSAERLDVTVARPMFQPYFEKKENMNDFLQRINTTRAEHIYLFTRPIADTVHFHTSVVNYLKAHQSGENEFHQIR